MHAVAVFLNPSFMYDGKFKYEQTDVKDDVKWMVHPSEMDDFVAELLRYNGKSQRLFNTLSVLMMKKVHPRLWWEYNGGELSLLQKVVIRILSQPCSSSARRINWSA
ncbi:hypothetical protein GIB67_042354 [Kingdonia uniflora]|uniref:HAT C-terminal dimerisation domain-containing protein n=1 Tax=Kingdonia uniflora TaxID=39325 RepID=A0A7J7N230_9MAGN|nr:hypothetical protein GIB67_042354 [Kingdonia uniflora]